MHVINLIRIYIKHKIFYVAITELFINRHSSNIFIEYFRFNYQINLLTCVLALFV